MQNAYLQIFLWVNNVLSQQTGTVILAEEHRELGADERVRVISRTVIH